MPFCWSERALARVSTMRHTQANRMRHFGRISSAIGPSRSRSVRLCYKNACSVTSGRLRHRHRHLTAARQFFDAPQDVSLQIRVTITGTSGRAAAPRIPSTTALVKVPLFHSFFSCDSWLPLGNHNLSPDKL